MKATAWVLKEQGFIALSCEQEGQPPMGASPDGLLEVECRSGRTSQTRKVMLEYKSRFPFVPAAAENAQGAPAAESYKYAPFKKFPAALPATHFAQVQLGMLATCTTECIYLQYSVEKTEVRVIPYSAEWVAVMEVWVKRFWAAYYSRLQVPPANFGNEMNAKEYSEFLSLTRSLCGRAPVVKDLLSPKGVDKRMFV
ncbi:hypothetical protein PLESTM_001098400 [Pleodorina starrii]|nr:hypothetical protein PLESTM_001098400 [Pleodorina starrii]